MKFLLSWALIAVGLMILWAGIRQYKWWLWVVGSVFSVTGFWYLFTQAIQ